MRVTMRPSLQLDGCAPPFRGDAANSSRRPVGKLQLRAQAHRDGKMEKCAAEIEKFWNKTVRCHEAALQRRTEIAVATKQEPQRPDRQTKCVGLHGSRPPRDGHACWDRRSCTRTATSAARRAARRPDLTGFWGQSLRAKLAARDQISAIQPMSCSLLLRLAELLPGSAMSERWAFPFLLSWSSS